MAHLFGSASAGACHQGCGLDVVGTEGFRKPEVDKSGDGTPIMISSCAV